MDLVLFTILGLVAIVLAFGLMVFARRGRRVDDHPLCRKCRYDLSGSTDADAGLPYACPECGRSLDRRRAVRIGNRVRRTGFIWVGLLLILIGLCTLTGVGFVGKERFVAVQSRPDWMLILQVNYLQDHAAIGELYHRGEFGMLDQDQYDRLLPTALDVQADLATPWDPVWGDFIEQAIDLQMTTPAQEERYMAQVVEGEPALILPASIKAGDAIPFTIDYGELRIGNHLDKFMELGNTLLYLGEAEDHAYMQRSGGGGLAYSASGTMRQPGFSYTESVRMPWLDQMGIQAPGKYELKLQAFATMELRGEGPFATPLEKVSWEITSKLEVVEEDETSLE